MMIYNVNFSNYLMLTNASHPGQITEKQACKSIA